MLPDPLARLQQQYDQLVSDAQAGNITLEQAQQSLANMVVVDGSGARWSKDVQGNFTRADGPSGTAQPADPAQFAADRLPPRADAQDVPPWADPHLMGGDGQMPPGGAPWPGHDAQPGQASQAGQGQAPMAAYEQPNIGRAKHLGDDPDDGLAARARRVLGKASSAVSSSGLIGRLPGDRRTVMVILGGVALLVGLFVYQRLATDPLGGPGGGVPVAGQSDVPGDDRGQLPDDGQGDQTPAGEQPAPALPVAEDRQRIVSALTSGDRATTVTVVVNPGGPGTVALQSAQFSGMGKARVALKMGAPSQADGGPVQARMTLVDADSGAEYAQATVTWLQVDGAWKLQTWPAFTPTDG